MLLEYFHKASTTILVKKDILRKDSYTIMNCNEYKQRINLCIQRIYLSNSKCYFLFQVFICIFLFLRSEAADVLSGVARVDPVFLEIALLLWKESSYS